MVVHSKQEKWSVVTFRLAVRHQSSSKRGTKYIQVDFVGEIRT